MSETAQWQPAPADLSDSRIADFARFATSYGAPQAAVNGAVADRYDTLHAWSVADVAQFWRCVWDYFQLGGDPGPALGSTAMPGAQWFPQARLNYADCVFRGAREDRPAIIDVAEDSEPHEVSWAALRAQTVALARTLRAAGVGVGDRVVGYLPNIPEAVVALLATASIGAVWSACGQDYSAPAALTRLGQLGPKVLITADGYRYGGKAHDKREAVRQLLVGLPTVGLAIMVPRLGLPTPQGSVPWSASTGGPEAATGVANGEFGTEQVPFDHPLWVVFSSGTTGLPKGIMHGHGGVVLEHLKSVGLQLDLGPDDIFFWFTSPSWMMWNFLVAGLMVGSTIVTYDGSPAYPAADGVWKLAAELGVTFLGTSPGYVLGCAKAQAVPRTDHDLSQLRAVGITGSTLPASSAWWLTENVGERVQTCTISGGTDVVSAFVGPARTVPVWAGEISRPCLGVALDSFDEAGSPVRGEVGELVITAPMPSMPVSFWNDPDGARYRGAYFDTYPGVWRHGDWITITDRGSVLMHGRSDSTLNRHGVRMGSADIYQVVEQLPQVREALVLGVELPDGGYWMPLYVQLAEGVELDEALQTAIKVAIRDEVSPRHVPDEVIAAPGVPHTRTGKKLEVPLKRIMQGADPASAVDRSAVDAPELLDWFAVALTRRPATAR